MEKRLKKNLDRKESAITLIALIVTIVVLLILAGASIAMLSGENGIIKQAQETKNMQEMGQIKEEAYIVKTNAQMNTYAGDTTKLTKSTLLTILSEHFKGSVIENGKVVTNDKKYDVVVKNNLDIEVVKHDESISGKIEITYEIIELDENTKIIKLDYSGIDIETIELTEEELESFVNSVIGGNAITDSNRDEIKQNAQNNNMTYSEYLKSILKEEGVDLTEKKFVSEELAEKALKKQFPEEYDDALLEQLKTLCETYGYPYRVIINMSIENPILALIMVEGTFEDEVIEIRNSEIITKESGTFKVVATTEDGAMGEVQIVIDDIINEKFSEIYTASEYYEDELGNRAKIPAGFAVGVSEDINSIDKGLVITDSIDNQGKSNGNEYVWIPVSNIRGDGSNKIKVRNDDGTTKEVEIALGRYIFDEATGVPSIIQYGSDFESETELKTSSGETDSFQELKDFRTSNDYWAAKDSNETAKDLAGFISSVEENGGFYMARYEASYESGSSIEDYKLLSKVSKRDRVNVYESLSQGMLWNNVIQGEAAKISKNMYTDNSNIESDLINSYAWDTAIVFIQNCSNNLNYANHSPDREADAGTGLTGEIECNIYDMAGGLSEWTTEFCKKMDYAYETRVARGGQFDTTASRRGYGDANELYFGFRPILYVH